MLQCWNRKKAKLDHNFVNFVFNMAPFANRVVLNSSVAALDCVVEDSKAAAIDRGVLVVLDSKKDEKALRCIFMLKASRTSLPIAQ